MLQVQTNFMFVRTNVLLLLFFCTQPMLFSTPICRILFNSSNSATLLCFTL